MSGKRTQADRDFDLNSGREIERKDAEIERLRAALRRIGELCDAPRNSEFIRGQIYRVVKDATPTDTGSAT